MLTKHSVLLNKIRNEKYKRCKYRCFNFSEFGEALRPFQFLEGCSLLEQFDLEVIPKQFEYFTESQVGEYSVYFERNKDNCSNIEVGCYYSDDFSPSDLRFTPVQLELPYESV